VATAEGGEGSKRVVGGMVNELAEVMERRRAMIEREEGEEGVDSEGNSDDEDMED
jgi:hypothetical protein